MPESSSPPAPLTRDLLRELHGFLSLEAPFLIRDLPQVATEERLEKALLQRIGARYRTGPGFAAHELYPAVTHQMAVSGGRRDLETLVRGFFERRRIKATLTAPERQLMLRTMLLTREVDDFLKRAFDRREIRWQSYPSPQKGFRSTGQEAIVGAALRLRRYPEFGQGETYRGDYISPLIRDLGALLMFCPIRCIRFWCSTARPVHRSMGGIFTSGTSNAESCHRRRHWRSPPRPSWEWPTPSSHARRIGFA